MAANGAGGGRWPRQDPARGGEVAGEGADGFAGQDPARVTDQSPPWVACEAHHHGWPGRRVSTARDQHGVASAGPARGGRRGTSRCLGRRGCWWCWAARDQLGSTVRLHLVPPRLLIGEVAGKDGGGVAGDNGGGVAGDSGRDVAGQSELSTLFLIHTSN